jgi:hypothetical protein
VSRVGVLLAVVLLVGCARPAVVVRMQYLKPNIPPSLLTCAGDPSVPDSNLQSAAVEYMIDEHAAWQDCSDHLAAVGTALETSP